MYKSVITVGLDATGAFPLLMKLAQAAEHAPINIGAMLGGLGGPLANVGWMMPFVIGFGFAMGYALFSSTSAAPAAGRRGARPPAYSFCLGPDNVSSHAHGGLMHHASEGMHTGMMGNLMNHLLFGADWETFLAPTEQL